MTYQQMYRVIEALEFDKELTIFSDDEFEIYVLRPSELKKRFEKYDRTKNFQIWLRTEGRQFRPNHLRVMIDLFLRTRSRPDLKRQIAKTFDDIFYGADVGDSVAALLNEKFEHFLNSVAITAHLSQLFIIEQIMGYHKPSKYSPASLFYQGWIRQIIDSDKEIDNL